jgi:hypothetical protein
MILQTLLAALMLISPVNAEDGKKTGRSNSVIQSSLKIEMMVVHAHTRNNEVHPTVLPLMQYFASYRFTGFDLIETKSVELEDDGSKTFTIQGDRKITVHLLSHDDQKARLKVTILGGKGRKLLDTTMLVNRNGTFIVAGPKFKEGILILPVTATY